MDFLKFFFVSFLPKLFWLLLSLSAHPVHAQVLLRGTVIDSASLLPIPQVHVNTTHSNTISDADGNFSLMVFPSDTVHFSHISYHEWMSVHPETHYGKITVSLRQKIILLKEVKIYSYLSERMFKQMIIEKPPVLSQEEEIALINSRILSYVARYAPPAPMDAFDNYIDYMKGPQGVVILSSNPSKGLIRALKNVITPATSSYKKFFGANHLEEAPRH